MTFLYPFFMGVLNMIEQLDQSILQFTFAFENLHWRIVLEWQMHIHVKLSNEVLLEAWTLHSNMWFHITMYFVYWAISRST